MTASDTSVRGRAVRRADAPGDTRQRLLDVAAQVFAERGYEGARVQEIAKRAGLTTGAIYANFENKAALLLAVVDVAGKQALRALPTVDPSSGAAALVKLWLGRLAVASGSGVRMLFVEVLTAARREDEAREQVVAGLLASRSTVAELVRAAEHGGAVDGDSAGHFLLSVTVGSYLLEAAGLPLPDADSWSQLVERVTDALAPTPQD